MPVLFFAVVFAVVFAVALLVFWVAVFGWHVGSIGCVDDGLLAFGIYVYCWGGAFFLVFYDDARVFLASPV